MGILSAQAIAIFYAARRSGFKLRVTIVFTSDSVQRLLSATTLRPMNVRSVLLPLSTAVVPT
jgi:hypothetical protein